jgi:hypothetical protein
MCLNKWQGGCPGDGAAIVRTGRFTDDMISYTRTFQMSIWNRVLLWYHSFSYDIIVCYGLWYHRYDMHYHIIFKYILLCNSKDVVFETVTIRVYDRQYLIWPEKDNSMISIIVEPSDLQFHLPSFSEIMIPKELSFSMIDTVYVVSARSSSF